METTTIDCPECNSSGTDANIANRAVAITAYFVPVAKSETQLLQCQTCKQEFLVANCPLPIQKMPDKRRADFLTPYHNPYGIAMLCFSLLTLPIGFIGAGFAAMAIGANPFHSKKRTTSWILLVVGIVISLISLAFIVMAIINRDDSPIKSY